MSETESIESPLGIVEFDLHGMVGLRLVNATPRDAAVVERQIGPLRTTLACAPDVTIRFVDVLPTEAPLRTVGVGEAGFAGDDFLVLRGKHKAPARVRVPFDRIGRGLEIVCERGVEAVPLLIPIVNLTALGKGVLPMHASAFEFDGRGLLVTGWSKGGKTETLLGFMAHGAKYVGDEWVYLAPDGGAMYGIPEPIRLWYWHLANLPDVQATLGGATRVRLRLLDLAVRALERLTDLDGRLGRSAPVRAVRSAAALLRRQLYVQVPPRALFDGRAGALVGRPDQVVFVANHDDPEVRVEPIDPREIARRMVFSLRAERAEFMAVYAQYRFAFPDRANELIDRAEETERRLLLRILDGKESWAVHHPYPVDPVALFEALEPVLAAARRFERAGARQA